MVYFLAVSVCKLPVEAGRLPFGRSSSRVGLSRAGKETMLQERWRSVSVQFYAIFTDKVLVK